jgi:glutamate synthase domain-containing protein 1
MCGIVGLLVEETGAARALGELMVPMLIGMTERGPDSAGMAVFGPPARAAAQDQPVFGTDR